MRAVGLSRENAKKERGMSPLFFYPKTAPEVDGLVARFSLRARDRTLRSGGNESGIFCKDAGGIARLWRLPVFHSLAKNIVADFNFQGAGFHIEADGIAIAYRGDRAAECGFG